MAPIATAALPIGPLATFRDSLPASSASAGSAVAAEDSYDTTDRPSATPTAAVEDMQRQAKMLGLPEDAPWITIYATKLSNRVRVWAGKAIVGDLSSWKDSRQHSRDIDEATKNHFVPSTKAWLGVDGTEAFDAIASEVVSERTLNRLNGTTRVIGGALEVTAAPLLAAPEPILSKAGGVL